MYVRVGEEPEIKHPYYPRLGLRNREWVDRGGPSKICATAKKRKRSEQKGGGMPPSAGKVPGRSSSKFNLAYGYGSNCDSDHIELIFSNRFPHMLITL